MNLLRKSAIIVMVSAYPFLAAAFPLMLLASLNIVSSASTGSYLRGGPVDLSFGTEPNLIVLGTLALAVVVVSLPLFGNRINGGSFEGTGFLWKILFVWMMLGGAVLIIGTLLMAIPMVLWGLPALGMGKTSMAWIPFIAYGVIFLPLIPGLQDWIEDFVQH